MTTPVYRVYIKATPQAIWDAITKPEWSEKHGYGGRVEYDLRPGGTYRVFASDVMKRARAEMGGAPTPDVIVDGEVVESDPPRKLVQAWRSPWTRKPRRRGCRASRTRSLRPAPASASSR